MNAFVSLVAVLALFLLAYLGVAVLGLHSIFGIVLPYAAILLFLGGFVYRIVKWASVPVPFRIPTTCGQQKTLPWIKSSTFDNPSSTVGVIGRMALEVLCFRSLFRNTKTEVRPDGPKIIYNPNHLLWVGALAFHYCFLLVFLRHIRFFTEPVPLLINLLQSLDGFFQIGAPPILISGFVLLAALCFLLFRRLVSPEVRYISLTSDYFPLLLIIGIATTGILLRHFVRTDIVAVKELGLGLLSFKPVASDKIHYLFYVHLLFVSTLFAYFPFSKLMHMGGVFLSPTRNLANTNRAVRHDVGWTAAHPVPMHTYEEYEDDFRDKMKMADIPVDKE